MDINKSAQWLSLVMSFPAFYAGAVLIYKWSGTCIEWLKGGRSAPQVFAAGIVVSFFGSGIDGTYWGAAWSLAYKYESTNNILFEMGVYPNIIFRQGCDFFAAYLHVQASSIALDWDFKPFQRNVIISILIGIIYVFLLEAI